MEADSLRASGAYKSVTCLWELVSFLLHFYHLTGFSRFDDVSKNWIGSMSLFINPLLKKLLMTNLRTS